MTRKALIVAGSALDLPGVEKDVMNYKQFFMSPLGGAWMASEVSVLKNPTKEQVEMYIRALQTADYSITIFAGHGSHPKRNGSTVVELRPGVQLEADDLKIGATKHTLVLDCC